MADIEIFRPDQNPDTAASRECALAVTEPDMDSRTVLSPAASIFVTIASSRFGAPKKVATASKFGR